MIWNPWKQNRILRDQVKMYSDMAFDQASKTSNLKNDKEHLLGTIDAMNGKIHFLADRVLNFSIALQRIADEEKPTSNATVKRMAAIAREGLDQ